MQHDVKLSGEGHELGIQRKEVEKLAGIEKGPRLHSPVRKTHSSDTLKVAPHIHENRNQWVHGQDAAGQGGSAEGV